MCKNAQKSMQSRLEFPIKTLYLAPLERRAVGFSRTNRTPWQAPSRILSRDQILTFNLENAVETQKYTQVFNAPKKF